METIELLFNNKILSYTTRGTGIPVVLLHGFGEDSTIWREQTAAFEGCRLILPDLPGSGASRLGDASSMESLADAVHHILEHERINGGAVLLGHSMGGYVALAFAERYPHLLAGFGLIHSTAYADNPEKMANRKKGIDTINNAGPFAFLKATIPNLYAPGTKAGRKELVEQHIGSSERFTAAALIGYYRSMMERPDRTSLLKETTLPVLFLLGRHDTAVPLSEGLAQCHLPRVSYIHILEQSGHMGMLEEPGACNRVLTHFVSFVNEHRP